MLSERNHGRRKKKEKDNKFITYIQITVVCSLLLAIAICYLLFCTNIGISVTDTGRKTITIHEIPIISVSTITDRTDAGEDADNGWEGPIPGIDDPVDNTPPIPPGTVTDPDDVEKYIYNYLKAMGYDDCMIAGIMGNMLAESGMRPERVQGDKHSGSDSCLRNCVAVGGGKAHGLVQWDGGRRDNLLNSANANGAKWYTKEFQMDFFKSEVESTEKNNGSVDALSTAFKNSGVSNAVDFYTFYFANKYERCAGAKSSHTYNDRGKIHNWSGRSTNAANYYATITSGGF